MELKYWLNWEDKTLLKVISSYAAFEEIGHSPDSRELLKKFYVGDLDPKEPKKTSTKPARQFNSYPAKSESYFVSYCRPSVLYLATPILVIAGLAYYKLFLN